MSPRLLIAAAAVFTYLAAWAVLVVVCLFNAGERESDLPSPSSWTLRAGYLTVALLVGLLTFLACRKRELSLRHATVPAGLALAAVLVVPGSMYADGVSNEHSYLKHLPPGMSREAGLAYGHQACDWLTARPWGRPPRDSNDLDGRSRTLVYLPHHVQWHWANSTERLIGYYIDHLDAQHPGPLTQNERQQASVTAGAWFELCPFQQWVHRPVQSPVGDRGGIGD